MTQQKSKADFIFNFNRRTILWTIVMAAAAGLVRALPVWAALITLFSVADQLIDLQIWLRIILWFAAVAGGVAALATGFYPRRMFGAAERSRTLARRAGSSGVSLRSDDLWLAVELGSGRHSGSADLADAFMEKTADKIARCRAFWAYPERRWSKPVVSGLMLIAATGFMWAAVPTVSPFNSRVLNPFQATNLERTVRVTPGDANVPLGSDVEIRLELLEGESRPDLMVRSASGWARRVPDTEGRERRYLITNIVEPLTYRVRWRGQWSRRYEIVPIEPIRLSQFNITVRPPAYTGQRAETQTSPEITAMVGSQATLSVKANRELLRASILFSDGQEKPVTVTKGLDLQVPFMVDKSGTYAFALTPTGGGPVEQTEKYPINVVEDKAPEIVLLSPTDALSAGEREKIPLTYDVRDDIQVSEVRLEWESRGRTRTESTRKFGSDSTGGIFTHQWNLRASGLRPGDAARYRLVASDANTVTGPGVAATPWMEISVQSFEREHEAIEQALEAFRDASVDLLAQMNTLKSKVEKSDSDLPAATAEFNQSAQFSGRLEEALRQIVNRMENDPLADFGVTMEHRAMLESLQSMNRTMMPSARAALNTNNRQAAASEMENIASELERMTSLSEELTKRQNARDVLESGERLEKLAEELTSELEGAAPNDPQLAAKLNEVMEEARRNLEQIARSLQKMPDELPEDFVNQQALKNVEVGKAQDILSKISDAVKRGDMKSAIQMAQQFLAMTQAMRENLSDAHEGFSEANSASELEQKIGEQQKKLEKIVDEQRALLAETQKLETARLERRLKSQEEAFKKLAARQRAVVNKGRDLAVAAQSTPYRVIVAAQLPPMEEVAGELESRRVDRSFEMLATIGANLRGLETEIAKSTSPVAIAGPIEEIRVEEEAILEELKKLRDEPTSRSDAEKPVYEGLKQREEALARQTNEMRQQLQALSRQTASLGLPVTQPLSRAAGEMKSAGSRLSETDSHQALRHEEAALSNLLETQNGLSEAQSAMQQMGSQPGGSGGGPRVMTRPGSGGQRGTNTGRVRLPTAEDYRPPREFREDLLESLKENYPKIYEEIIHRYYRRLAE